MAPTTCPPVSHTLVATLPEGTNRELLCHRKSSQAVLPQNTDPSRAKIISHVYHSFSGGGKVSAPIVSTEGTLHGHHTPVGEARPCFLTQTRVACGYKQALIQSKYPLLTEGAGSPVAPHKEPASLICPSHSGLCSLFIWIFPQ